MRQGEGKGGGGQGASGGESASDRRRNLRFECCGSAEIALPEMPGVVGKIRDLSLLGCSLETSARFKAGSQVKLVFEVNRLPFSVMAVVKSHREGAIGLEFSQVSRMGRGQLTDLMQELAEMKE
jgi:hypothetical protein